MAKNKNRKQPQASQERSDARGQEQQDTTMERQGSPADVARKSKKNTFGHN